MAARSVMEPLGDAVARGNKCEASSVEHNRPYLHWVRAKRATRVDLMTSHFGSNEPEVLAIVRRNRRSRLLANRRRAQRRPRARGLTFADRRLVDTL
jgi:hypothetical protein